MVSLLVCGWFCADLSGKQKSPPLLVSGGLLEIELGFTISGHRPG
jgi:hypothetical protein